jgi:hypothetical protein
MDEPQKININHRTEELIAELQKIFTFTEAQDWGRRALAEIEGINRLARALDLEIARETQDLARIQIEGSKKSLVGRLFGGGASNDEKERAQRIEGFRQAKPSLIKAAQQLQEYIDFTPTSPEQQKKLLQELRLRKREIQEKKREITTVIRNTRPGIIQQPEEKVFDPSTISRRKARYARDSQVLPHEKMEDAMNRQSAQIELDIQWVEKFRQ